MRLLKNTLVTAALLFGLSGCTLSLQTGPDLAGTAGAVIDATGSEPRAPLAETTLDDRALIVTLETADTIATGVDALVAAGVLEPGTPRALAVRDALVRLRRFLTAASAAQRAGEAETYAEALREAATAAQDITRALRGE